MCFLNRLLSHIMSTQNTSIVKEENNSDVAIEMRYGSDNLGPADSLLVHTKEGGANDRPISAGSSIVFAKS